MGDPPEGQGLAPEKLEAYRRRVEELEALGVPTEGLQKTLEERPQDFEREADEALRRELQGGLEGEPPAEAPAQEVTISPATEPPAAPEAPAEAATAEAPLPPAAELTPPAAQEAPPEADELAQLEATVAELIGEPPPAPTPPAPEPVVLETPEGTAEGVEASLEEELAQALGEAGVGAAPSRDLAPPPPLAGGDSLSIFAPPAPAAAAAAPAGAKPPPPSALSAGAAPTRVVVRPPVLPEGAKPAAAAGGSAGATEVLPTAQSAGRRFRTAAVAALLLIGLFATTYLLLVNGAPAVAFTFSPLSPQAGEPVAFSANGTADPNNDPITFHWNFGDDTTGTGAVVRHTYNRSGNYTVTLTATDDHDNSNSASNTITVAPGTITPPVYRYGDGLAYTVDGTSRVESALGIPLASFNVTFFGKSEARCDVTAVNLAYDGSQSQSVQPSPVVAKDGFLAEHTTYVLERSLPDLRLSGRINTSCQNADYFGNSAVRELDFMNPQNNDTIRSETNQDTAVTIPDTAPEETLHSTSHLTDFPRLANASGQLHFERYYAGHPFSTENFESGAFEAEGINWSWIAQGTEVIGGYLAVKVHFVAVNRPATVTALTVDLWVSSASSFPLKEVYYVRGIDIGKTYESRFTATANGAPTAGAAEIPYGDGSRSYQAVLQSDLAPMTQVPRSTPGADFAFTARTAYDEGISQCPDFATYMATNPQAYSVNGTYTLNAGNPRWMLEFAEDSSGERKRIEDEHSTSSQVRCSGGSQGAVRPLAQIGQVVSLNYAANLMKLEDTASALFPANAFNSAVANFTVKQDLKLPGISFNAASSAARQSVPFAFGVESHDDQPTRVRAYVDAQAGQLVFALTETGDSLP